MQYSKEIITPSKILRLWVHIILSNDNDRKYDVSNRSIYIGLFGNTGGRANHKKSFLREY